MARELGGFRSADVLLRSLDYGVVRAALTGGDRKSLAKEVLRAGRALRRGGAEALLLCSNSLHGVADRLEAEVGLPLLHVGDAVAARAVERGHRRLALFGTGFTMQAAFMRRRLEAHGLEVVLPRHPAEVDGLLLEETARGLYRPEMAVQLRARLEQAVHDGADAVVLGCTEIPLLVPPDTLAVPSLDSLALLSEAGLAWLLASEPQASR